MYTRHGWFVVVAALILSGGFASAAEPKLPEAFSGRSRVKFDPRTRLPDRVIGIDAYPAALGKGKVALTEKGADAAFRSFLADHQAFFGVKPDDLVIRSVTRRKGTWFVKYQQVYRGLPVEGATVGLSAAEDGKVQTYASSYLPGIAVSIEAKVTLEQAVTTARATYSAGQDKALTVRESGQVVYAPIEGGARQIHVAWKFLLAGARPDADLDIWFVVDALNGRILKRYARAFPGASISGRVTGDVFPVNPTAPPMATEPLKNATVEVQCGGTPTTDANGDFTASLPWYSFLKSTFDVAFRLEGPFAEVGDYGTNTVYEQRRTCRKDQACDQHWNDADPDNSSVFFHINRLHDWYLDRFGYQWTNAWQGTARFRALVNRPLYANASAGDPMVFGNDAFARSSDVVYHECTHNVLYAIFGDWVGFSIGTTTEGYAFDEGFADYFAGSITDDPRHGEGYGGTRTLSNTTAYGGKAGYATEGHTGGTIIAGAAWDLRDRLRAQQGDAGALLSDTLVFDALNQMAVMTSPYYFSDPQESNFLTSLYLADDDDGNLLNGTPHAWDIRRAFAGHELLRAVLRSSDSYDVSANTVGNLTGGDFYFLNGSFWSNNADQRGVQDLGDVGATTLDDVTIPVSGYTRQAVAAAVGHTYAAMAQQGEGGRYVVFRVDSLAADGSQVAISYRYRALVLVDPFDLCRRFPFFCHPIDPCRKLPQLCGPVVVVPERGRLTFPLRDHLDQVVVPVQAICKYVVDCPGCGPGALCPGFLDVAVAVNPAPIELEVRDPKGDVAARVELAGGKGRLRLDARGGLDYLLVARPAKDGPVGVDYTVLLEPGGR